MSGDGLVDDLSVWTRRALMLLRRESDLRWRAALAFVLPLVFLLLTSVADGGLGMAQLLGDIGWGLLSGVILAYIPVDNRMQTIFPDYGDDDETEDADDSLRARYVRGEIDHETFKRQLDAKLSAPADGPTATEYVRNPRAPDDGTPAPITSLRSRYAHGEIDEREYRERLATLQETDDEASEETTATELAERN
jgi:uncharacterized membrane protein